MTKSRASTAGTRPSAELSAAQIRAAIRQLEARIAELRALDVALLNSGSDPEVLAIEYAIDSTLARIFGSGTPEYVRLFKAKKLDATHYVAAIQIGGMIGGGTSIRDIRQGVDQGRKRAIALLGQEVALMKEQLGEDGNAPTDRAIRAYGYLAGFGAVQAHQIQKF